ncbi:MAG: tRNA guanosine(34) transglycosylase Tgt [Myxococcaceae bacterium]|nr:tRNA guanosine(34) transglycosylase Tgt [Myxococcaceae bacterium]
MSENLSARGDLRVAPSLLRYELLHVDAQTGARRGRLHTPHGTIETPVFMPVGTAGSVKAVAKDDLLTLKASIILGNTYHLMLRPGAPLIAKMGGLHQFIGWDRPMLTDSGGFQVYSLAQIRKITEEGAAFQSHLDGSKHLLTPESAIEIQETLGADIIMAFDECPPSGAERSYMEPSLARTTRWLKRCHAAWSQQRSSLFGIVQGGLHEDLRRRHVEEVCAVDLPGYALGGFSVGETPEAMHAGVAFCAPLLPKDKPRYVMGVGTPRDLVTCVASGVDMFDCVLPTRTARNGLLFTSAGRLTIKNARFVDDQRPVDEKCSCYTCRTFTRAYLRHLFVSQELVALRLNSLHNLHYFLTLMAQAREAIERDVYGDFLKEVLARPNAAP